jgi:sugar phosphate isomerase/epimerase
MKLGFHCDAFNSVNWSFEKCLQWAQANDLHWIECGVFSGPNWIHGLGYFPHVALHQDPLLLARKMDTYGVRFSQIDAAYPMSGEDALLYGVRYTMDCIRWAKLGGIAHVDTTDGLHAPEGLEDEEAMALMKRCYERIIEVAEAYEVTVNIEPHGYFTTNPDRMAEMLDFVDSPYLRMNMDTGNTFIAGQEPVAFLERFVDRVSHVHIKDVSQELADALRGKDTGIAMSQSAIGDGVNADHIRGCLEVLRDHGYDGALSIECEGQGGPLIEKSVAWMRETLADLGIAIEE